MICGLFEARAMADWKTALTDWLESLVEKLDRQPGATENRIDRATATNSPGAGELPSRRSC
jgi:hypothetical protein